MYDLVYLFTGIGFFALMALYARLAERLWGRPVPCPSTFSSAAASL